MPRSDPGQFAFVGGVFGWGRVPQPKPGRHKDRGENTAENLITLCNVDHDEEHRNDKS